MIASPLTVAIVARHAKSFRCRGNAPRPDPAAGQQLKIVGHKGRVCQPNFGSRSRRPASAGPKQEETCMRRSVIGGPALGWRCAAFIGKAHATAEASIASLRAESSARMRWQEGLCGPMHAKPRVIITCSPRGASLNAVVRAYGGLGHEPRAALGRASGSCRGRLGFRLRLGY